MGETKRNESRDYKERFEFEFTVGEFIICQRYFKISNFNPMSLRSFELTEAIRDCVKTIDGDLKDKTYTYLNIYAPKAFDSEEEMRLYVEKHDSDGYLYDGQGLVVRGNSTTDFVYGNGTVRELGFKFDDGELTTSSSKSEPQTYKFAFKVDGVERCSMTWEGNYPKFVRDKIDLSNKRGKFEGDDLTRLSFEQYLLYKMVEGKSDLVYGLIKTICNACGMDNKNYTTRFDDIEDAWGFIRAVEDGQVDFIKKHYEE